MKKSDNKWFLTKVKQAISKYKMINNGDRVAVGSSGGRDSTSLLYILSMLRDFSHLKFELFAIHLDGGWRVELKPLKDFCNSRNIPLEVKKYPIGEIIKDRKGPCALCARLRRGIFHSAALELGCNKVALAHHLDDAIETFFLNLIFTGQMRTFLPSTYLDRTGLTLIRPLVFLPQKTIVSIVKRENLPVIPNPCPFNGKTKREEIKNLVTFLAKSYPDLREKFLNAVQSTRRDGFWNLEND